jgi:endonuclease YncB( thermonuclease family)
VKHLTVLGLLAGLASSLLVLVAPAAHPSVIGDRDCSDFATQAQAQEFFLSHDPADDPHNLDADGDRIACESNPCPCSTSTTNTTPDGTSGTAERTRATVLYVVDGDTLRVRMPSGAKRYVRILGIDTPEVYGTVECGGPAASRSMEQLLTRGSRVLLVSDPSQDRQDRYHRLLRYVVKRSSQVDVGHAQLRRGWATVYVYQHHPFRRVSSYWSAQHFARVHDLGIWKSCR